MEICDSGPPIVLREFDEVEPATVFRHARGLALKLNRGTGSVTGAGEYNAVGLESGDLYIFGEDDLVEVLPDANLYLYPIGKATTLCAPKA